MKLHQRIGAGLFISMMVTVCPGIGLSQQSAGTPAPRAAARTAKDVAIIKDFEGRVDEYLKLQKDEAPGTVPSRPTPSAEKVVDGQQKLGAKIRSARPEAKQGDIFTPEIASFFRRQIAKTLAGPHGGKIRASLRHAEPVKPMSLKVNDDYPDGVPLQSTPATLLLNLPTLPKELQYRIVGHDLFLVDANANVIVDFIQGAIPATSTT